MRRLMDGTKRRLVAGLAVTAALLVPLAVLGGPALARGTAAASSQYQYKVQVCHRTHSKKANHQWVLINISSAAVPAHLRHGDQLAPPCPPANAAPLAPTHGHGHGNGNGNGNSNGKGHGK
jgi:hypothetical protein